MELKRGKKATSREQGNIGHHDSLQGLKALYANGHASKEDYAAALRAYQAAIDATKSKQREVAEQMYGAFKNR